MRTPYKQPELEQEYGDLESTVLELVNEHGQAEAARQLGVSQPTVSQWLSEWGYKRIFRYEKDGESAS